MAAREYQGIRIPAGLLVYYTENGQNIMLTRLYELDVPGQSISANDLALSLNADALGSEPQRVPLPRGQEVGRRAYLARAHVRDRIIAGIHGRNSWRLPSTTVVASIVQFEGGGLMQPPAEPDSPTV